MINSPMEYKGYLGSAEVDVDGQALVGKLLYIRHSIAYSALTVAELENAFHEAVDDYLDSCKEDGVEPDLPCKGTFNVRIGAERHRQLAVAARQRNIGLNEVLCEVIDAGLAGAVNVPRSVGELSMTSRVVSESFSTTEQVRLRLVK